MTDLTESGASYPSGIYQLELTDPVLGGPPNEGTGDGMSNIPHKQLADRTAFLKAAVDSLLDGSAFAISVASPGYYTFPGGLILQWGTGNTSVGGLASVTYPIAFPTGVFAVSVTDVNDGATIANNHDLAVGNVVAASMEVYSTEGDGSAVDTTGFFWMALGH